MHGHTQTVPTVRAHSHIQHLYRMRQDQQFKRKMPKKREYN